MIESLESTEAARQSAQADAERAATQTERNRLGQFATPRPLALDIAQFMAGRVPSEEELVFCDPAVGTGAFFSAAMTAFGPERIDSAIGIEIDSDLAATARRLWAKYGLEVFVGDFCVEEVRSAVRRRPNMIITNPPYVRHHHIDSAKKRYLQAEVESHAARTVSGLSGLYVYYVLLASAWLARGGTAAWLLPTEFLDVNYGEALKQYLLKEVSLKRVHRFAPTDEQFADALVTSCVVVYDKVQPNKQDCVEFTYGGSLSAPDQCHTYRLNEIESNAKWTQLHNHERTDEGTTQSAGLLVGDLLKTKRGVATGANAFFILERQEAQARGLPERFLRPILPSPRHVEENVIGADKRGYPNTDPQLCLIDCDLPPREVEGRFPALWEYLKAGEASGLCERYLLSRRDPWYAQEQRDVPLYLSSYMGRKRNGSQPFRVFWNKSQAIATNVYLLLYPTDELARLCKRHPHLERKVFDALTHAAGSAMMENGRVYGGGLHKIEPKELLRTPLSAFLDDVPELSTLVTPRLF